LTFEHHIPNTQIPQMKFNVHPLAAVGAAAAGWAKWREFNAGVKPVCHSTCARKHFTNFKV
jgi:hypothetical protein